MSYSAPSQLGWLPSPFKGWCVSLVIHGVMFAAVVITVRTPPAKPIRFGAKQIDLTVMMRPSTEVSAVSEPVIEVDIRPATAQIDRRSFHLSETSHPSAPSVVTTKDALEHVDAREEQAPSIEDATESARRTLSRVFSGAPPLPPRQPITLATATLPDFRDNLPPVYPQSAIDRQQQGIVTLRVSLNAMGEVTDASVLESSGFQVLDAAAISAVKTWTAKPATRQGHPVPTTIRVPVRFRLPQKAKPSSSNTGAV